MKRALVSVYDKTGLVPFVKRLSAVGYQIVSSGGTAATLVDAGVEVTSVADVTGAPEILGGRVKTLHPKIHGGILARGDIDDDDLNANGINRFDLVVCNLYPFRETVADPDATPDQIVEKIDIGGPTMVRAAAKNHARVAVVVSPHQYAEVASALEDDAMDDDLRRRLASEAFFHTASYDAAIVGWLGEDLVLPMRRVDELRYGENPHQMASLYVEDSGRPWWIEAVQHQGKAMSFNNYADAEAAWRLVGDLGAGSVAVMKHMNAAGAASGDSLVEAFDRAWAGDPLAAFGGVIGINGTLQRDVAEKLASVFVEVVIALDVTQEALDVLETKGNLRVLTAPLPGPTDPDYRRVEGGLLAQDRDVVGAGEWKHVSARSPTPEEEAALRFAWVVAAHTKSNAIVLARGESAVGVGAGDQSRVGAAERAILKAGDLASGAVAGSDAFFPFRDGIDALAAAGVKAIVEPGGSRNDQEVIAAANEHGLALVFTGERHFRH